LLIEQIWEVFDAVLELRVELRPIVALKVVRNNDCPIVLLLHGLWLYGMREKIYGLSDLQGFFTMGFRDLQSLIVC